MDSTEPKPALENNRTKYAFARRFENLNAQTKMGIVAALIVFLALIAFGFIAARSLPGEALYAVKTEFLEGLNESVQLSQQNKAAYQVSRLEIRLQEVQEFEKRDTFSPEALADLKRVITDSQQTLTSLIPSDQTEVPSTQFLEILNNFAAAALAIETVSERNEKLQEFGEFIEDVRRESVNVYKDQVDRYVERETQENIFEYIRTQLSAVSTALNNADLNGETIDDAEVYINRVGPAMTEGNFPRALVAIAEAMRFIKIDTYGVLPKEAQTPEMDTSTTTATSSTSTPSSETNPSTTFSFPE